MKSRPVYEFIATLHRIETKIDGSGRIHLDIDKSAFKQLQAIQLLQIEKGSAIAVACVPVYPGEDLSVANVCNEEEPDLSQVEL